MNHQEPFALGLDFGSSQVKATVLDARLRVVAGTTVGWNEAGCSRRFISDWLYALTTVVSRLSSQYPGVGKHVAAIGISTVAPCLMVMNVDNPSWSSPLVQYDEPVTGDVRSRRGRTIALAQRLEGLTPKKSRRDRTVLLTANGWLCHELTGSTSIDNCSLAELGLETAPDAADPSPPPYRAAPSAIVGRLTRGWAKVLRLRSGISVVAGGSDSLALAVAGRLPSGSALAYFGTFFSLMEARADFSRAIPHLYPHMPYRWRISLPGGAFIERVAATGRAGKAGRRGQIEACLRAAEELTRSRTKRVAIAFPRWKLGDAAHTIPLIAPKDAYSPGMLALATIHTFAVALREHLPTTAQGPVQVAGGLSVHKWVRSYVENVAAISLAVQPAIRGAEGAALLAHDAIRGA